MVNGIPDESTCKSVNAMTDGALLGGEDDHAASEYAGILCDPEVEGPVLCDYSESGESSGVTDAVWGVKALGSWPHHSIG